MRPFLAIGRQEVVDLPAPWDPLRVLEEYAEDPHSGQGIVLSDDQLATLSRDGVVVRIHGRHRWIGAMEGEMRIVVLNPTTLELNIDGWATLRWWLRPFILPFRARARRAVEAQIDRLIEELETDIREAVEEGEASTAEPLPDGPATPATDRSGFGGFSWTLRVLTMGGDPVYERREGAGAGV